MKSTLSITVPVPAYPSSLHMASRTIQVPCVFPEAFDYDFSAFGSPRRATAYLSEGLGVDSVELHNGANEVYVSAEERAESILATIKATLGITGPVPPGSPLPAIALAYEAEVAAYDACMNAHGELPPILHSDAMYWINPSNGPGHSVRMLSKYVEHVVEQAAKVTP